MTPSTANDDEGARTLVARRRLPYPREQVFDAYRDAQRLARWWGPAGFRNTFQAFDFRPGGRWTFVMHGPDGKDYPNEASFRETTPSRVVIRHENAPGFTLFSTFTDVDAATEVEWRQVFDSVQLCEQLAPICIPANEQNLDRLDAELARQP